MHTDAHTILANCFVPHGGLGRLIVLEGVPGAGKTSASRYLEKRFGMVAVSQLDHTVRRKNTPQEDAHLWYIQAELARQPMIRSALNGSLDVIQDRNLLSALAFAYAWSKQDGNRRLIRRVLGALLHETSGRLVRPDVLVLLSVRPTEGLARRRAMAGEPEAETWRDDRFLTYHAEFYRVYRRAFPARSVVTIDSTGLGLDQTLQSVVDALKRPLREPE